MTIARDRRELVAQAFPGLGARELKALVQLTTPKKCRRGDPIVRQDEPGQSVFIIWTGFFGVFVGDGTGNTRALGVMGPGEMFGELSLLDGGPRSATVIAHTRGELLRIDREPFVRAIREDPSLAIGLLALLARRIRRLTERWDDLAGRPVAQRLAKQLLLFSETHGVRVGPRAIRLGIKLPQTQLGQLVGAARESVNHHINLWVKKKVLEKEGRYLVIVDSDALRVVVQGAGTA